MADGELTLTLDDETARRLRAAAEAAGRPVGEYAAELIGDGLERDWASTLAEVADYERTGLSYSTDDGMAAFDEAVRARFSAKS